MKKVMFIPDMHVPFHDKKFWKLVLKTIKKMEPDIVVVMGDFGDYKGISRYSKNPEDRAFSDELREVQKEIANLADVVDSVGAQGVFCEGNHEDRLQRFIFDKAPELHGMLENEDLLCPEGWTWVPYNTMHKIGKLYVTHTLGPCGDTASKKNMDAAGDNIVVGHSHRLSVFYGGTHCGKSHVGMSVGCGVDYDEVDYMPKPVARKNWQHGIGWARVMRSGDFFAFPVPAIDIGAKKVMVIEGQEISVR